MESNQSHIKNAGVNPGWGRQVDPGGGGGARGVKAGIGEPLEKGGYSEKNSLKKLGARKGALGRRTVDTYVLGWETERLKWKELAVKGRGCKQ